MDKKTIIGLGLIGLILAIFTFYNQPSKEELKQRREKQEQLAKQQKEEDADSQKSAATSDSTAQGNVTADNSKSDSSAITAGADSLTAANTTKMSIQDTVQSAKIDSINAIPEKDYVLQNKKIKIIFSNKGGGVRSVYLKGYQRYYDYIKNKGTKKITPLHLFSAKEATNGLKFKDNGKEVHTQNLVFSTKKIADSQLVFTAQFGGGKSIAQVYTIHPDRFDITYQIKMKGFQNTVQPDQVYLEWKAKLLKSERLIKQQRRHSTIFYSVNGKGYDYLSEGGEDDYSAEKNIDWVAFKQSYFSSIMMPEKDFLNHGTHFKIASYDKDAPKKDSIFVKKYAATMNLAMNNTQNGSVSMRWFFGPNDYKLLKSYNNGTKNIINNGWGIFRWFNIYFMQPVFSWLIGYGGIGIGLAIIIITFIVKVGLTPIQWKMFASSAKMRILKPEIEVINEKYPNKSDQMKKQMETMNLYKESGASPLSGCVPMLIQMPVLFAVFEFFPSAFALRQQSFLWAQDLSSYDSIWNFGFHVPLYGDHMSLFALLMSCTTLFYTVLSSNNLQQPSQPGMPNMKYITYFFPIMMIFFFNNYSAGLCLYYFISTLTSILTMLAIKKWFVDEDKLKLKMAERKAARQSEGKKKGKSKFQQRLDDVQKAQQQKLKEKKNKKK